MFTAYGEEGAVVDVAVAVAVDVLVAGGADVFVFVGLGVLVGARTTIDMLSVDPKACPAPSVNRQYCVYVPASSGACPLTENSRHSPGTTGALWTLIESDANWCPLTGTSRNPNNQLHVPLFDTFQVRVKPSFGRSTVPSGVLTSRMNARLLHP